MSPLKATAWEAMREVSKRMLLYHVSFDVTSRKSSDIRSHCTYHTCSYFYEIRVVIIWQAILRPNWAFRLANVWSGFYSTDHYHGNGPFAYFSLSLPGNSKSREVRNNGNLVLNAYR